MTTALRWRILTLQALVTVVLALAAGLCFWGSSFVQTNVRDQLAAQKITMPATSVPAAVEGLSTADMAALTPYSGQALTSGDQARAYADHYIAVHIANMTKAAFGKPETYSEVSGQYMALSAKLPPTSAKLQQLGGLRQTVFMGTVLRSILLQAYGWWQVGTYAFYAALALSAATIVVVLAFLFELVIVPRREGVVELAAPRQAVGAAI
jgi:hypothetical protein